ncbi:DUF4232 domain-containing protein [Streptomyces sp. NPDC007264]|uniref:DUF4232 domain-containing protein n=1 Tax=Streptomyces sp. NPDC007264 TaxID=3364777 RepID=UPI0036DBB24E
MSSLRTSRTRLVGAAATLVLATLSLTACSNGTGVHDEGASAATTPAANSSSGPSPSSTSSSGSASRSDSASSGAGTAAGTARPAADASAASASKPSVPSGKRPVTCEASNTKTVAAPLNRPVNHLLLTVTNTGGRSCYLYGYPAVRFGDAQAVPPVIEDSQPQAVVTLEPGESGYASVNLSAADGSGSHGHTVHSLTVYFRGRSGNESVGAGAHPSLPAAGVYVDDSLKVTYWQQSMDDAIDW